MNALSASAALLLVCGIAVDAGAVECPRSYFQIAGTNVFVESDPATPIGVFYGFSYDLVAGTVAGDHTGFGEASSSGQVVTADRYRIVGPATAIPIAFQARVHFTGTVGADQVTLPGLGTGCLGSSARLSLSAITTSTVSDVATVASVTSPTCEPRAVDETLELDLTKLPEEEFVLRAGIQLTAGHTIRATAAGSITFPGLPAGYSIQSCQGYAGQIVAARPVSWGRVKQIYR